MQVRAFAWVLLLLLLLLLCSGWWTGLDVGQYNEQNPVIAATFDMTEAPMLFMVDTDKKVYPYTGERSEQGEQFCVVCLWT
jgi:hypothetical protein